MAKFAVEKNIDVAPIRGVEGKYPFAAMQPGDSFLIPYEMKRHENGHLNTAELFKVRASTAAAFRSWVGGDPQARGHVKMVTRTVDDGLRVWLVRRPSASTLT